MKNRFIPEHTLVFFKSIFFKMDKFHKKIVILLAFLLMRNFSFRNQISLEEISKFSYLVLALENSVESTKNETPFLNYVSNRYEKKIQAFQIHPTTHMLLFAYHFRHDCIVCHFCCIYWNSLFANGKSE